MRKMANSKHVVTRLEDLHQRVLEMPYPIPVILCGPTLWYERAVPESELHEYPRYGESVKGVTWICGYPYYKMKNKPFPDYVYYANQEEAFEAENYLSSLFI